MLALQRVEPDQVSRYGIVKVSSSDGRVHEVSDMVEKPDPAKAPSNLAILGRYVLKPSIFGISTTFGARWDRRALPCRENGGQLDREKSFVGPCSKAIIQPLAPPSPAIRDRILQPSPRQASPRCPAGSRR